MGEEEKKGEEGEKSEARGPRESLKDFQHHLCSEPIEDIA
jgi:hypothetical protein